MSTTRSRFRLHPAAAVIMAVFAVAAGACTSLIGADDRYFEAEDASPSAAQDAANGRDAAATPGLDGGGSTDARVDVATGSPRDAGEAGEATDAATSADSAPDGNVVLDPSFENGVVNGNCGTGWSFSGTGTYSTSSVAHGGNASCLICNQSGTEGYLYATIPTPDAGSVLVGSAWLAAVDNPDGAVATSHIGVSLCYVGCDTTYSADVTLSDPPDWTIVPAPQVTVEADAMPTFIVAILVIDGCVLVDDVSLVVQ